ncbi:MAG TPA: hypothetical protein VIV40_44180, partial [Kofleriaceae bacterium]
MTKLAAALLLVASTASAQNLVATDGMERSRTPREIDGRIGMLLGGSDVGDADGFSVGISGALGYRVGDVTLRGLFDYYRVGDNADELMDRKGRATRVGGAVRYSFANTGFQSRLGVDFWGELGAGYEHVAWRHGGVLDRPSGEVAIGLDIGRRGEANPSSGVPRHHVRGDRNKIGYFMAFRSLVAQGP